MRRRPCHATGQQMLPAPLLPLEQWRGRVEVSVDDVVRGRVLRAAELHAAACEAQGVWLAVCSNRSRCRGQGVWSNTRPCTARPAAFFPTRTPPTMSPFCL